ncbi:helix-turn-helix domain-containing protein [Deinococcus ficus]|uniref:helix-turn-helix domain-containing protein n=1 Tax=Deinococcus ficus TaxID=317577 RepID=UPI0018FE27F7|nr:helix-turn-helix domain-containing protein [Deinococcus ficus]
MKTTHQAAALMGLHPTTIRRLIRSGRIPAHRFGRHFRIEDATIARLLAEGALA